MTRHNDITELIGKTPVVRLNRLSKPSSATIYGKIEFFNPGGSVKDRICLNMIDEAERLENSSRVERSLSRPVETRHRTGLSRRRAWIQTHPRDAGKHEHGTGQFAVVIWCTARVDTGLGGDERIH